jgi:hypothetical protein
MLAFDYKLLSNSRYPSMIRDCLIPALKTEVAGGKSAFDGCRSRFLFPLPPSKLGQIPRVL